MAPALLGVSVAQISLIINTQIASHLTPGSVTWLGYADRLMEFPTALLGVALGVVLLPALTQAKASGDQQRYSELIDDGLRWVMVLALPCAVALLIFAKPLVSVLFHYGAFTDRDLMQTSLALVGYGVGLMGLVAIKVLAPGFLCQPRHPHSHANCLGCFGPDPIAQPGVGALVGTCGFGPGHWFGRFGQRQRPLFWLGAPRAISASAWLGALPGPSGAGLCRARLALAVVRAGD
jgi:hypothetical protein